MLINTKSPCKQVSLEIKVIRADGSVEDLGVVAYWHKNPLKRLAWQAKQWLKKRRS